MNAYSIVLPQTIVALNDIGFFYERGLILTFPAHGTWD